MFQALIALALSLAHSLGGRNGALAAEVIETAGAALDATDEVKATVTPWIAYANKIIDEKRAPSEAEEEAIRAFAVAVRQQNHALATGTPVASLPPLPSPPSA